MPPVQRRIFFDGQYCSGVGDLSRPRQSLQQLRRTPPNTSLAWMTDEMPIMQDGELEHYLEAFRRAGLD
jgi:hypothetical protein